jgi:hypothetical protein
MEDSPRHQASAAWFSAVPFCAAVAVMLGALGHEVLRFWAASGTLSGLVAPNLAESSYFFVQMDNIGVRTTKSVPSFSG